MLFIIVIILVIVLFSKKLKQQKKITPFHSEQILDKVICHKRKCPNCSAPIRDEYTTYCKYCGERFTITTTHKLDTAEEIENWLENQK